MSQLQPYTDEQLLAMLQSDSEKAIDLIFRLHFKTCHLSAIRILKDQHIAEDLVQEVFLELWKKRSQLRINSSIKAYLRRSVVNRSLNYIRDLKMKYDEEDKIPNIEAKDISALKELETEELQERIDFAINELPERCRIVFTLSRYENMSYREIGEQLGISIKTVENQISKALKLLRVALGPYL